MRFDLFPTINPILSSAAELRLKSPHVDGVPMENRTTMTKRDGAFDLSLSYEGCKPSQCGTTRTQPARGPAVAGIKYGSPTEL
jgi:hypothetical protein